jgi:hypothetical protein
MQSCIPRSMDCSCDIGGIKFMRPLSYVIMSFLDEKERCIAVTLLSVVILSISGKPELQEWNIERVLENLAIHPCFFWLYQDWYILENTCSLQILNFPRQNKTGVPESSNPLFYVFNNGLSDAADMYHWCEICTKLQYFTHSGSEYNLRISRHCHI